MNSKLVPSPSLPICSMSGAFCLVCAVLWASFPVFGQGRGPSAPSAPKEVAPLNPSPMQFIPPSPEPFPGSGQPAPAPVQTKPETSPYSPMTRQQRWQDYIDTNFDSYGAFFQTFFTGLGDDMGNMPDWDSGAAGFSEHLGSDFAMFTIGGTIHSSLAAALHQDTRYSHCTCHGGFHRTLHALSRTAFTYSDNGHVYPDISGLAGIYGGPMLMTQWYPAKYTAFGYGVRQGNIGAGVTSMIYVIREFSPEIKRAFHRRKPAGAEFIYEN